MKIRIDSTNLEISARKKTRLTKGTRRPQFAARLSNRYARLGVIIALFALVGMLFIVSVPFGESFSVGSLVSAQTENIATVVAAQNPKTSWDLGQTAHAKIEFAPLATPPQAFLRRVVWIAPDGSVAQVTPVTTNDFVDDYAIPSSLSDPFAQVGLWTVKTIDNRGVGRVVATFTVLSPTAANANLSIIKSGPSQVNAGASLSYTVTATNNGPDAAQSVEITDEVPANTVLVSVQQTSGVTFTCNTAINEDGFNVTTCTATTLAANESASFTLNYTVNSGLSNGTVLVNTAKVSSSTNEVNSSDNQSSATTTVTAAAPAAACTIICPGDITINNTENQCSAIHTYTTPTTSGSCANELGQTPPVVCSPPSGSTFPVGNTTVTCSSGGNACSFVITVHDTRTPSTPTIVCPANITVSEESEGLGSATVNYAAPITTGNCVTTSCDPPSGSSFNVGPARTVNCTAKDSSDNVVTCSFTVTVTSGATCTVTCPGDITVNAASGQCDAVVTYSAPTTSGTCGTVTCTPASGSTFPVGTTTVVCTSPQGGCDFTVTVIAPAAPTITTCATNKSVPVNADCEGVIPNLLGEVVTTGCNVTKSQSPAAGSVVGAGIYTVTITAENSAGEATCTATVKVDNTPPVITCPANIVTALPLNSTATSKAVSYSTATATDNCAGVGAVTCSPASGSVFPVGTTTVTCSVEDAVHNTSSCSFTITVNYNFTGFFSPVGNPPVLNTVNAGRAIPVKFSLSGNKGLNIFAAGYPVSGQIACDASAPPSEVTETLTAGSSSLSYDATTDTYNYVWATQDSWAGTCRQLVVKLNDGSQYVANFKFR
ncbi:MAG: PxKF domain-containing protein [Blastocatellia bacterium]